MRILPPLDELLRACECDVVFPDGPDPDMPPEILDMVCLRPVDQRERVEAVERELGRRLPGTLREMLCRYDLSGVSVLGLNFSLGLDRLAHKLGSMSAFGGLAFATDEFDGWYLLEPDTGEVRFFSVFETPEDARGMAASLDAFLRVLCTFAPEAWRAMDDTEFAEVCAFLGVPTDTRYWRVLRREGEPRFERGE